MSDLIISEKEDITNIADAVREQTGETELMGIKEMPTKIRALSGVGVQPDWSQNDSTARDYIKNRTHWVENDGETYHPLDEKFIPETIATKDYVESLVKSLNSDKVLRFYCIEDVTIVVNGISTVYPANSNVEVKFIDTDVFEIIPTSNNSILALNAFPGALGTYYPWLEGVKQFSNILFDMNAEDMYSKWSQGNQGSYQVQYAQYLNCIFWSDNPYISDVAKRTNYTLYYTSQLPLCYSNIPDNTFKAFYLAFNVTSDPNWGNAAYRDSFAKATWATQVFSYYGARTIGIFGHDHSDFNIVLPKDCRGLMYAATSIENAGTFDAVNVTNFGAKSGSWREAFGKCSSLRNLYIKNLKVGLNVSWSPLNYDSIYFIISKAANTNAITISVSPYTYNLLGQSDFDLAVSKNITIELLTTNYVEDIRLSDIANKADKSYVDELLQTKASVENPVMSGALGLNHTGELGFTSVSLGFANEASGMYCFSEGMGNKSTGDSSHSEGTGNTASGYAAHAEGSGVLAAETGAHAEGANTKALGYGSHAEGSGTIAVAEGQHVEGRYNIEDSTSVHIVGNGTSNTKRSNAHTLDSSGEAWFAGDVYVSSTSGTNRDEGSKKLATEDFVNTQISEIEIPSNENVLLKTEQTLTDEELSQVRKNLRFIGKDVEGQVFTIDGESVAASPNAEIFGDYSSNIAVGQWSIAEGSSTIAKGRASHAEGAFSQALNDGCHVEGYGTKATGYWSHAEGEMTVVSSYASHAEGSYTKMPDGSTRYGTASGYASHTEGGGCHTTGVASHAEGIGTTANGRCAHVEGTYTIASGKAQHVEGIANIEDTEDKYIHIAGNGTLPTDRSNAYTLDWYGNGWYAGNVEATAIILRSSTEGSIKTFKLTIDDTGVLSVTENI